MARRQFTVPFAATGDKVSVPDAPQPDGSVSLQEGYGFDYQRDPQTDPLAKVFPRDVHNGLLNEITASIGEIQQNGYPIWVAEGAPYPIRATVRHLGQNWVSLVDNNNAEPNNGPGWAPSYRNFSTEGQARALTDTETLVSPRRMGDAFNAHVLGMGQTWQAILGRSLGVTYTNTTGRAIEICVNTRMFNGADIGTHGEAFIIVGGVILANGSAYKSSPASPYISLNAIVPNGSTYQVANVVSMELAEWCELR